VVKNLLVHHSTQEDAMQICFTPVRTAVSALALALLAACGGGGGSTGSTAPTPSTPPTPPTDAARTQAATATAQSSSNACAAIQPFYWEVGDKTQALGSGSVAKAGSATTYTASTMMSIASASKWIYGAYVAQQRGGVLTAQDIQFLNFRSGYTNFGFSGCDRTDTVASCVARGSNGVQTAANVGKFYYNGGHMQVHANLPAPGMNLGALDNAALAAEVRRALGTDIDLSYVQPQLAGGVVTNATNYAVFLRKLLGNQLQLAPLLGKNPVCTNPATCADALSTPITNGLNWHYALGHWVEDGAKGDGAFSSAGAFGFYPWIDAAKTTYGIVARTDVLGGGNESATCGALIRKAWLTAQAQ
jgi:hypothetical protein